MTATAIVLRDGRSVTIRPVQAEDAEAFGAAFARLSPEARYNRMMGSVRELLSSVVQKAVNPVAGRELALVAVAVNPEETIVGGARYIVDDHESCEFAVAIADQWQRVGLASHLLKALIAHAREHRLKCVHGYVLASNKGMLDLAARLGFAVTASDDGPTVRIVRLKLSPG
jgi:RimJ/RimL family protein N-acetyltransferase